MISNSFLPNSTLSYFLFWNKSLAPSYAPPRQRGGVAAPGEATRNTRTRAKKVSCKLELELEPNSKASYRTANGAQVDSDDGPPRADGKVHHSNNEEGKLREDI